MKLHMAANVFRYGCRNGRCNRVHLGTSHLTWEDSLMSKDVDMGMAGSITMIILVSSIALLLVSFYKRYSRMQKREDDGQN